MKNDRLNHVGYLWAFSVITASPGAKAHYRRRRDDHGEWHTAAQRNRFNRIIGQLYHCLHNRKLLDTRPSSPRVPLPFGRQHDRSRSWLGARA